jgi:hypothetical protein
MDSVSRCQALSLKDVPKRRRGMAKSCGSSPSSAHAVPSMRPRSPMQADRASIGHGWDAGPET